MRGGTLSSASPRFRVYAPTLVPPTKHPVTRHWKTGYAFFATVKLYANINSFFFRTASFPPPGFKLPLFPTRIPTFPGSAKAAVKIDSTHRPPPSVEILKIHSHYHVIIFISAILYSENILSPQIRNPSNCHHMYNATSDAVTSITILGFFLKNKCTLQSQNFGMATFRWNKFKMPRNTHIDMARYMPTFPKIPFTKIPFSKICLFIFLPPSQQDTIWVHPVSPSFTLSPFRLYQNILQNPFSQSCPNSNNSQITSWVHSISPSFTISTFSQHQDIFQYVFYQSLHNSPSLTQSNIHPLPIQSVLRISHQYSNVSPSLCQFHQNAQNRLFLSHCHLSWFHPVFTRVFQLYSLIFLKNLIFVLFQITCLDNCHFFATLKQRCKKLLLPDTYRLNSSVSPSPNYKQIQLQCCTVNTWQLLHQDNFNLLNANKVHNVSTLTPPSLHNQHFLPFLNGSPILLITLFEKQLLAMLDSGSSKNLCSSKAIGQICPDYARLLSPYEAPFSDVQGKLLQTQGILNQIQISINHYQFTIDIIIFESPDLTFLLGFEFIKQFDLQITARGLLMPSNACHKISIANNSYLSIQIPAHVDKAVFIEARCTQIVDVNLDLHQSPLSFSQLRLKHLIASSEFLQPDTPLDELNVYYQYINLPVNGKLALQFSNFDDNSITLHAGQVIAHIEEMIFPLPHHESANYTTTPGPPCHQQGTHYSDLNHISNGISNPKPSTLPGSPSTHSPFPTPVLNHPVLNHVYHICKTIAHMDQLTEAEVHERLNQVQYHCKSNPTITDDAINVQSKDPAHLQFSKNLVYSHANLFTSHSLDIGEYKGPPIHLNLRDGVEPIAQPQYPISPKLLPATRRLIQRFISMGIVGHSTSSWNLPIFVLSKKAGEKQNPETKDVALEQKSTIAGSIKSTDLRLILDSRIINANLKRDYQDFPIPRTIDIVHNLFGAKYVGIFDVSNAFFSHKLTPATAQYFGFTMENLKLEFKTLPQGCLASPTIFCSHITRLITNAGLTRFATWPDGSYDRVQVYFDNITVSARTEDNYKQMLSILFDVLLDSGYRLKISKAFFFITQKFILFAYEINLQDQTIMPERKKINQILAIQRPRSRRQARQLLGSFGYFHTLLPNINKILSPIYQLASDKVKFEWSETHTASLEKAKQLIAKSPVIFLPNPKADYYVWTDSAIRENCAYFIFQYSKLHKSLVLISCYSHKLTMPERSFSQYHVELFAIVLFVSKNFHKIQYSTTWIFSDCAALSYAIRYKAENSCLLRYWTLLHSVDLRILFTPATHPLLHLADLISRSNNTLKLLNRRITQNDITNLPILDWSGLPPLKLTQIEEIVNKFYLYEAQIRSNNYLPNLPKAIRTNHVTSNQQNVPPLKHAITHCHSLFPSCRLVLTPFFETSSDFPKMSFKTEVPGISMPSSSKHHTQVPLRTCVTSTDVPLPLPPAWLTGDHQWVIYPQNIFAIKSTIAQSNHQSITQPHHIACNFLDLIIDKPTLDKVIFNAFPTLSMETFIQYQQADKRLASLLHTLTIKKHLNYEIFHGVLCKIRHVKQIHQKDMTVFNILCPESLSLQLLQKLHVHQMVHLNFSRLQSRLRDHWQVRNFAALYRTMIQDCHFCAVNIPQPHGQMHQSLPVFYSLRDAISFDHCCVNSSWKTNGFLNITEQFSTHITLIPLNSSATANEIAQLVFTRYISVYAPPKFIVKDNGSQMTNSFVDSIAHLLQIKCIYTTPFNSRSNSKCELGNKKALACFRLLHQTLPGGLQEDYLPIYCAGISNCLNSLPLKTLNGLSAKICMTGIHQTAESFIPLTSHQISPALSEKFLLYRHYSHLYETLYSIYCARRKQFDTARIHNTYPHKFREGQFVRIRAAIPNRGSQHKLRPIYSANIYRIVHVTHSTAMLLDLNAQMYFKKRLKGRGKLISPVLKRVKITQLKIAPKPAEFLQLTESQLKSVLQEIDKVPSRKIGFVWPHRPTIDQFQTLENDKYLQTLINSRFFKQIDPTLKQNYHDNTNKFNKLQQGHLGPNQTVFTSNGLFITTNEQWPQIPCSPRYQDTKILRYQDTTIPKYQDAKIPRCQDTQNARYTFGQKPQHQRYPFIQKDTTVSSPKNVPVMHTHITGQSMPVCQYASMPECAESVRTKKLSIVMADAHATGHHQKNDHATKTYCHQHKHGFLSSPYCTIIKHPCTACHVKHFPCVYAVSSTVISQKNMSLLPFPENNFSSTIGFDHNDAFDFDKFRAKKDRHLNNSPLYKNLMKHNINPIKVFIKPFLTGTPDMNIPSIESSASFPPKMTIKNQDKYSSFNDWQRYYPQPLKTFSSNSTLYLTNSQISSLLASTFSSQQSFRSCTSSRRPTSDISIHHNTDHHHHNDDISSHHHHHSSDQFSTGNDSESESKNNDDTSNTNKSESDDDDDHEETQQAPSKLVPLLGKAKRDYLPPSLSAPGQSLRLQVGKPIHSISSLASRAKKGLKTMNKLGKPSIKKGKTPTKKSLTEVEKNSNSLQPSIQSSSKRKKISPSIIAQRRASLRSKANKECPPPHL